MSDEEMARQLGQNPGNDPQKDGERIAGISTPPLVKSAPAANEASDGVSLRERIVAIKHRRDYHLMDEPEYVDEIMSLIHHHDQRIVAEAERRALKPLPIITDAWCVACGNQTLFLGEGGYITCALEGCPNPTATYEAIKGFTAQQDGQGEQK